MRFLPAASLLLVFGYVYAVLFGYLPMNLLLLVLAIAAPYVALLRRRRASTPDNAAPPTGAGPPPAPDYGQWRRCGATQSG